MDEDSMCYRVHYVDLEEDAGDGVEPYAEVPSCERFTLYRELATRIKVSLTRNRKLSPVVRIDMPFDCIELDGGLRLCGKEKRCVHGVQRFPSLDFRTSIAY